MRCRSTSNAKTLGDMRLPRLANCRCRSRLHAGPWRCAGCSLAYSSPGCATPADTAPSRRGRRRRPPAAGRCAGGCDWPVFRGDAAGHRRRRKPAAREARGAVEVQLQGPRLRSHGGDCRRTGLCRQPRRQAVRAVAGRRQGEVAAITPSWASRPGGGATTAACSSATPTAGSIASKPPPASRCGASRPRPKSTPAPNFYKDKVLFGSQDATLYCLNAGHRRSWSGSIRSAIRFAARRRSSRAARFWPAATPSCTSSIWTRAKRSPRSKSTGPPARRPRSAATACSSAPKGASFFAIDWREAKVVWTMQSPRTNMPFRSSAAVTRRGRDLRRPRQEWCMPSTRPTATSCGSFATRSRVDSSPVVVGERVFVGSSRRPAVCARSQDGQESVGVRSRRTISSPRPPWPTAGW